MRTCQIKKLAYRERLFEEFPKESWCLTLGQVASAGRPKKLLKLFIRRFIIQRIFLENLVIFLNLIFLNKI